MVWAVTDRPYAERPIRSARLPSKEKEMRLAHSLFLFTLLSVSVAGCGTEKSEAEKDKLTPQALKAMENPPPGAPGAPPGASTKAPPGQPAPGSSPVSNPDANGGA